MLRVELKEKAKEKLEGKKLNAAVGVTIVLIIEAIVSRILNTIFPGTTKTIAGLDNFTISLTHPAAQCITWIVGIFFGLGLTNYFLKLARGEEVDIIDIFSYKGGAFVTALFASILTGILTLLGYVFLIIPGVILSICFAFLYHVILDNPELGIIEVIKKSISIMQGHKLDYFVLHLSFIGWYILIPFSFGLLYFLVMPYFYVTLSLFYDSIKENENTMPSETL